MAEPRPRAAGPRRARTHAPPSGVTAATWPRRPGLLGGDRRGHGPRRRGWVLLLPGRVAPPMRCRRPTFSSFIYTTIRVIMVTGGLARGQRPVCLRVAAASAFFVVHPRLSAIKLGRCLDPTSRIVMSSVLLLDVIELCCEHQWCRGGEKHKQKRSNSQSIVYRFFFVSS